MEKILVIGASNVDLTAYSFKAYQYNTSNPGYHLYSLGGVGRNIAENLALLGHECDFITVLGSDFFGKWIEEQTAKEKLNFKAYYPPHNSTGVYLAHMDYNGELVGAIADMEIMKTLSPELLKKALRGLKPSILVFDNNLSADSIEFIINYCQKCNIFCLAETVSVEKCLKIKPYLNKINVITPSLDEAEIILEQKVAHLTAAENIISVLAQSRLQKGIKTTLIITAAARGVFVLSDNLQAHFPPLTIKTEEIKGAVGAGDAFTAGFVSGLAQKKSLSLAVEMGLIAAKATLMSVRTVNLNLATYFNNDK